MIKKMLLLVIVLLGVWGFEFYRREFSGLGPVPERSSFSGRLPFTVDGNFRRFQFFYSTNRKDSEESFKGRGNVRVDTLVNGTFDALIHPGLNIRPFVWFEDTSMNLDNRTSLQEEEYYKKIKAAVANSTEKSLLVVVWGFRDWFQSAAIKTAYTSYILDIDAPAVLFDWPGNQGEGRTGYLAAREVAVPSAAQLGEWLKNLKQKSGAVKIWIMGSSLGCQVITDALVWLNDHKPGYKLNHVILSAPDVAYESFNNKLKETIPNTTDHLTTFVSSNDRALLMSAWINGNRKLGRIRISEPPEERNEEYEFEEADKLLDYNLKEVAVVDATPINLTRNLHHFFTDSPEFFDDLYQRLLLPDHLLSRRLHQLRQASGRDYWILWSY